MSSLYLLPGCLLLLAASDILVHIVKIDVNLYTTDEPIMHAIATTHSSNCALGWTSETSPCIDSWTGVACNRSGRVGRSAQARQASMAPWPRTLALSSSCGSSTSMTTPSTVSSNASFFDIMPLRLDVMSSSPSPTTASLPQGATDLQHQQQPSAPELGTTE